MEVKTILFGLFILALTWYLLSSCNRRQYGGMSPGVFDQLGSNEVGWGYPSEDSYLIAPGYADGYDDYDAFNAYGSYGY